MPLAWLFWMIYIIAILFSGWVYYAPNTPWFRPFSGLFIIWVLIGILGYRVFGAAVK
jgi:hypothetical protein